jgi:hypothetical protein
MKLDLEKRLEELEERLAREIASKKIWRIVYIEEPGCKARETVEDDRSC